jgi:tetratricopeptide (TPR) repeat protein
MPLPVPPTTSAAGIEALSRISSVALFVDRAGRVRPDFRITERNADSIAELCRRLDGIPLALELAAAWARLLTPAEMLVEFRTIIQSRDSDLPARHRSLAAAVEGSYRLLGPDLRRFFRRLSVFRAGWTVAGARAVCDAPDALLRLGELQDRSLLLVEERDDGSRYQFLETLREFAEERLIAEDPADAAASTERHTAYFASLTDEADAALKGADQAAWLTRLASEHENVRAALSRATPELRLQMASHLHRYWMVRGHIAEGRAWIVDTLARNPNDGTGITKPTRISALNIAGALALSAGDLAAAQDLFTQCLALSREVGDEVSDALSRVNLAIIASQQGDLESARREYEESLPIWRRLDRTQTLAIVLSNLGAVAVEQNDFEAARHYLEESLSLQTREEDSLLRANTLHNLAEIAYEQKDAYLALAYAKECLAVRLALEDHSAILNLVKLVARLKHLAGLPEMAAELYGASDALAELAETVPAPAAQTKKMSRVAALRRELGEEVFSAAWERGRTRTWPELVELVRQAIQSSSSDEYSKKGHVSDSENI